MKTTYSSLLQQVRRQIKDDAQDVLDDATVKNTIMDALRELASARPDARLDKFGRLRNVPAEWSEDPEQPVPLDEYYVPALVALSLAKLHMRDGLDLKDEALASRWMNRYTQLVGG